MSDVTTYVVFWPARSVLKVGRTRSSYRVRRFTDTGAQVLLLRRNRAASEEAVVLRLLSQRFERAFGTERESIDLLPGGRGFTECFIVSTSDLADVIDLILGGFTSHGNDKAPRGATRDFHRRGAD